MSGSVCTTIGVYLTPDNTFDADRTDRPRSQWGDIGTALKTASILGKDYLIFNDKVWSLTPINTNVVRGHLGPEWQRRCSECDAYLHGDTPEHASSCPVSRQALP